MAFVYFVDLNISLKQMIQNAKALHRKLARRYPNITLALIASLSVREGWTFVEEQPEALLFRYREKDVCIPKHGSGKDAARLILFEEMAQRPLLRRSGGDCEVRNSVRRDWLNKFDNIFESIFQDAAEQV
jgi:hypothetical protein